IECGPELDETYRNQVEHALVAVENLLAAEDPQTKVGDPVKLKAAAAALDESTKPLAEIMMDKVMEAMLRKKGVLP
ncbi:MAG: molecular chaperone DnaK, partial [Opitutaceae bacterium]|nr:molecular chaperone DnaK [Verrucomicrobiales bacterium]